jgi:hypothetical protein
VLLDYLLPPEEDKLLYARDGWLIPTRTLAKESRQALLNRAKHWELYRPKAVLRSLSHSDYPYNCVGMIFAARRKWIDIEHMKALLQHDGYAQIPKLSSVDGDLVLYRDDNNDYSHVGLIILAERNRDTMNIKVLSKWGKDGEYEHFEEDIPPFAGKALEYWTERQL